MMFNSSCFYYVAVQENGSQVLLPWPPQVTLMHLGVFIVQCHVFVGAVDDAILENKPRCLG